MLVVVEEMFFDPAKREEIGAGQIEYTRVSAEEGPGKPMDELKKVRVRLTKELTSDRDVQARLGRECDAERITELFVVVENRAGALGELLGQLAKAKINIEAIGLFQDIAKLSVSDIDRAMKALTRARYQVELREVLRLDLDNKPGSFAFVASRLGTAGINIDYCYGTVGKGQKSASVVIDVKDLDRAVSVLEGAKL